MKYLPINAQLFVENRKKLVASLPPNSMAIILANDEMPRSADQAFVFRQNPDLFWLSGIDQEKTILIIYPDCPNPLFREALFLRKTNEIIAVWEGHKYTMAEAREASGISQIFWEESFDGALKSLMTYCDKVFVNINENDRNDNVVPYKDIRFANELKYNYPAHEIKRLGPIMAKLRSVKHPLEIDTIKHACNITRDAFKRVLQFMKAGVMEYEVEAEIIHEFIRQRATGHAYTPIIASGASACVLHYIENNRACNDGDLVLMDFGAEYANYAADLTRTIPANGKFTQRQKDVYNAVLRVMKQAKTMLKPGVILADYNKEVGQIMEAELIGLGLLDKDAVAKQDKENPLYKKYFMHGTSHFLGIDVHDIGNRYAPMQAGNVFTCEPGIYIPEEKLGIRIENDILITEDGIIDLMADIPIEVEEIEDLMNTK
ncbi:MAG TPA: aminopeptidase P family protein [Chitinophagales bacterium]|nr:aminopeptidase P family protein [Chitinophagales bacterium]HMW13580.1 aminopeptidase P family protein [Chitinophagales bacterium]HMX61137.1 aminopeptidase P family protein [Chitinophagales bacterium]HMY24243.1 aminopeptidase P family protein [Chitinophagales bacterium]HNA38488.1 aminopeptidase P family protein [Chitinophagales bacterium]